MPFADIDAFCEAMTDPAREVEVFTNIDYRSGASAIGGWAARWNDLSVQNNTRNGCLSAPGGTPRNPTRTTDGALKHTPPAGGHSLFLPRLVIGSASTAGLWMIYDRLGDVSGFSGAVNTTQTITGGVNDGTRYTDPEGNLAFIQIWSQIGTTATTFTVSYTNQDGVSGRTSHPALIGGTGYREAGKWLPIPLIAGDTAVLSVESITLAASTGTAGDIGVTIVKPLKTVATGSSGLAGDHGFLTDGVISRVKDDACLCVAQYESATTGAVNAQAQLSITILED